MREYLFISDLLDITPPPFYGQDIRVVKGAHPFEDFRTSIDNSPEPIICVFIIPRDEYNPIQQVFSTLPPLRAEFSIILMVSPGATDLPLDDMRVSTVRSTPFTENDTLFAIRSAFTVAKARYNDTTDRRHVSARLEDMYHDQDALIRIGRSLQTEKDPDKLLRNILMLSKQITGADAGSIYLVEDCQNGKQIRFKYSNTYSKDLPLEEFTLPYDTKSIAGYVAITGNVLNIPDVYKLSTTDPVSFNNSFDKSNNYRTKSMLIVPMRNHIDEIIGVIQLINSKEDIANIGNEAFGIKLESLSDFDNKVVPFDSRYEHLMEAVAGQAAIAIENTRMVIQIQHQFEAFVKASVSAIESRDPATSGHSLRVSKICVAMAREINNTSYPPFDNIHFTDTQIKELELAALLHDFGKVYIDLGIFMKAKKLFPKDFDNLILKIDYLYRFVELMTIVEENAAFVRFTGEERSRILREHEERKKTRLQNIRDIREKVIKLNEPSVTEIDPAETLAEICKQIQEIHVSDINDNPMAVFNETEQTNLSIKKGSLNDAERREIESHVTHTYTFVSKIPWPPEYKDIPEIALGHHEKLDGTGYPTGKKGNGILLQARIMAIADVYDALTATDRPYKPAIPHTRAIEILRKEAETGKIDRDLFSVFIRCDFSETQSPDLGSKSC